MSAHVARTGQAYLKQYHPERYQAGRLMQQAMGYLLLALAAVTVVVMAGVVVRWAISAIWG